MAPAIVRLHLYEVESKFSCDKGSLAINSLEAFKARRADVRPTYRDCMLVRILQHPTTFYGRVEELQFQHLASAYPDLVEAKTYPVEATGRHCTST